MPRKRTAQAAPLRLEFVDWLLDGDLRRTDEDDPLRRSAVYDCFLEYDSPRPDLAGMWHEHRVYLLAEWQRRGGTGSPWGSRFDEGPVR